MNDCPAKPENNYKPAILKALMGREEQASSPLP